MRTIACSPLACVVVLASVAGGLGCETSDSAVTEDRFCGEYVKRECAAVAPLCAASAAQCEAVRIADCQARVATLKTAAAEYTVRAYRKDNVTACLDKVKDTYSRTLITGAALKELDDVCNRVFQGASKLLQACRVDVDCEGSLVCDPTKLLCGQKRTVPAGGQCANIGETCSAGEFCKLTGATYLCARRAAKTAACTPTDLCLESLRCSGGACVDKAVSGEACAAHDDCQTGYCSLFSHKCAAGLIFAEGADSCRLFLTGATAPDAGAPDAI
jgi:hypothetical protein